MDDSLRRGPRPSLRHPTESHRPSTAHATRDPRPRPRGYLGTDHQTIGSDILAVLQILKMPEQVLGKTLAQRLAKTRSDGWYPIEWLLELMDVVEAQVGHVGLVQMGRRIFRLSHEARVRNTVTSARDVVYGMDAMYHYANRGTRIGGWSVMRFEAGSVVLEKNTPHHCVMEQGILAEALASVGCPVHLVQTKCFRGQDRVCVYAITSSVTDSRWTGR